MNKRQAALPFIFVTLLIDIIGIGLIIPILPKLIEQFAGGNASSASFTYGLLGALYALMQFIFAPVLGSLSDRYGRRPVILISLLGLGLDYILLATAQSLPLFFIGRTIAGITGASITAASAYIADVSPPEKRAQNFGLIGAAFGLGFILGPALGGLLGGVGLRVPFMVAAGLTLLNFLYGLFVLPESLKPENRRNFSWARANPVGSLLSLSRYPVVLSLAGSIFLNNLAQNALQSTWVLYTGYRYGWTVTQTGISLAVVGLTAAIVQGGLVRVLIPKLGEKRAIIIGQAISAVAFLFYGLAPEGWMLYVILFFGSLGGIGGPATQGMISRSVEANEQGAVQGSLSSLTSLTGILGPLIATAAFGYFTSPKAPVQIPGIAFFIGCAFIVIALLVALRAFQNPAFSRPANAVKLESSPVGLKD
jgi:MFS transporter, DHA1 family, tetracycline resistance protein